MDSIFELYTTRKNAHKSVNSVNRFKKMIEDLINNMDIDMFERLITKIVNDCYIIKIDSIIYKIDDECVKLLKKMVTMFSENNIKHPIDDYSDNDIIRSFMIDIKENKYIKHHPDDIYKNIPKSNNENNNCNDINYLYNMISDILNNNNKSTLYNLF